MKKNIQEIVASMKQDNPSKFKKIDDKVIARVIKELFNTLNKELATTEEKLKVVGLGNFRILKRDVDGEKTKKIIFRPQITTEKRNIKI